MPTHEGLQEIVENLDQMQLGPDDTFRFKCCGCGKCCKNREDILLNPRDLFRLAMHMKQTPDQVVARCCETYIGDHSRIPVVRLRPVGKAKVCPLLKDNRCSVHAAKPSVCALYPLGRFLKATSTDPNAPKESGYFIQPITCGGHKQTTVRAYLESFGIPLEDVFHVEWNEMLMHLSEFCVEALCKDFDMDIMWGIIYVQLYLLYDMEQEFLPQFESNIAKLRDIISATRANVFSLL